MLPSFDELFASAKQPVVKEKRVKKLERFSREDDDAALFEECRAVMDVERILIEDQTLINGLPAEAVLSAVDLGYADDALLAEVSSGYAHRRELIDIPEYVSAKAEYWELRA